MAQRSHSSPPYPLAAIPGRAGVDEVLCHMSIPRVYDRSRREWHWPCKAEKFREGSPNLSVDDPCGFPPVTNS